MAITALGSAVTATANAAATTLTTGAPANATAGNLLVALVACDNTSAADGATNEITSITDAGGNIWKKAGEYCNSRGALKAGATVAAFYCVLQANSGAITANFSNGTDSLAKAITVYAFSGLNSAAVTGLQTAVVTALDPPSMTISGLPSREYLFVRAIGIESNSSSFTPTAGYTSFTTAVVNNGSVAASIGAKGEFRILAAATGDSSDPAATSADNANLYFAIYSGGVVGALTSSLANSSLASDVRVAVAAAASNSAVAASLAAAASHPVAATFSKTLGATTLLANDLMPRSADLAKALGAASGSIAATAAIKAALSKTLGPATLGSAAINSSHIPITDQQFSSWLADPSAIRTILVEASVNVVGSEITRYMSNHGFVTNPQDLPANTVYEPIITGGIKYSEMIDLAGQGGMQWGDIELHNHDGRLDGWLYDTWTNRTVKVFIGDQSWRRTDFRQVFDGVVESIDSRDRTKLNLKLRDKLQRLNVPVTETLISSQIADLQDAVVPLTFGECHNISPILIDQGTLTYQFHNGSAERVIEVRDSAVPVGFTADAVNGKFTLTQNSFGAITASVQGENPDGYLTDVASIIERLVTFYGPVATRFTAADIDSANFSAFKAAHPEQVGAYLGDRANLLEVVTGLANSIGAQLVPGRDGKLRLFQLDLRAAQAAASPRNIAAADMVANTLQIATRTQVVAAIKLAYCKNWTVQNGLQTAIPEEHKALYGKEWLIATAKDSAVAALHKLDKEPDQQESLLLARYDAEQETARRLKLWSTARTLFAFTGYSWLLDLSLGDSVLLTHERFGLAGGKRGMVVMLTPDWLAGRVDVGVLV